ncbi:alpha/beta fold hydrolase [Microbacterium sp. YY-01]|uniref:alpha/beta fold hydrolase n=1 Tax=Microbacterium sp. YY-01 TaxID=3421634 RepID=UPI003D16970D
MTPMKPVDDSEWQTHDGGTLKAYTFGSADAPPERRIVIVCGAFLPALVYAPFASALAKQFDDAWGIYVYDRRGKGGSSPVDSDYSFDTEKHDVATALQHSNARHLVGHSLGGSIALHATRMLCESPSLQSVMPLTTTVYDPAINVDGSMETEWVTQFQYHYESGQFGRAMALVERNMGMSRTLSYAPSWMVAAVLALTVRSGLARTTKAVFPAGAAELAAAFKEEAHASEFADLATRLCLMTGERSADYFHATTAALARSVRDADVVVSPRGLHGSVPAVRHRIVESLALWLQDKPLGELNLGAQALKDSVQPVNEEQTGTHPQGVSARKK